MPTYKLTYFDIRGRGELSRLVFAAAGKHFEDVRVSSEHWPQLKPNTPLGSLPLLEIDGKMHVQSLAIAKYLAREFKFAGKNSMEELKVDEVLFTCEDLCDAMGKAVKEPDEAKKKELTKKIITENVPRCAVFLESILSKNGTGFFVGNSITIADLVVYNTFETIINIGSEDSLKSTPKLLQNMKRVEADAKISSYLKKRKPSMI